MDGNGVTCLSFIPRIDVNIVVEAEAEFNLLIKQVGHLLDWFVL